MGCTGTGCKPDLATDLVCRSLNQQALTSPPCIQSSSNVVPFWNFLKELSSYYTNLPLPLLPLNPLWLPSPTGGKFGPPGDTYRALHDPHTSPYPTSIAPVCATISSTLAGDFFALLLLYSLLPPIQSPHCSPRNFYKCRSHLGTSNSLLLP